MRARISKYRCIHNLISLVIFLFVILTLDTSKILYANENTYNIGKLRISSFYLRGTIQSRPAAAYMTIQNSGQISDSLLSATSPMAGMIEFHETRVESGVAKMRQVRRIRVKPQSMTVLKPGGLHLMIKELKIPPIAGGIFVITLKFEHAGTIDIKFPIKTFSGTKMEHTPKKSTDHTKH